MEAAHCCTCTPASVAKQPHDMEMESSCAAAAAYHHAQHNYAASKNTLTMIFNVTANYSRLQECGTCALIDRNNEEVPENGPDDAVRSRSRNGPHGASQGTPSYATQWGHVQKLLCWRIEGKSVKA
ncbi:hypothetical protein BaRGS_00005966 [Batillaria attramentaria]|uniref:Cellulase n=1 Tax=Batillaria attramentaria TaxID=370345 RepID=A0ABD0LU08_9CAEN